MTPHEKAVNAINLRLERLRAKLGEAKEESAQRFLFQAIIATIGVAEALSEYIKAVGNFARRRHGEVKAQSDAIGAQHADLLKSGQELLEKLKANPADRAIRKEIEQTEQQMAVAQKSVRRTANALQRELGPSVAVIDEMALNIKRFSEADQTEVLKRVLKALVAQTRGLYSAQLGASATEVIDGAAWEKAAAAEIDQAGGIDDAYARTGYQAILALEMMMMAVSESPPGTALEAIQRANESVAARLKELMARFTAGTS